MKYINHSINGYLCVCLSLICVVRVERSKVVEEKNCRFVYSDGNTIIGLIRDSFQLCVIITFKN